MIDTSWGSIRILIAMILGVIWFYLLNEHLGKRTFDVIDIGRVATGKEQDASLHYQTLKDKVLDHQILLSYPLESPFNFRFIDCRNHYSTSIHSYPFHLLSNHLSLTPTTIRDTLNSVLNV